MLSNFSQFAPQGQAPHFPGLQAGGSPQLNPALFGLPGVYANGWLGQEPGLQGGSQPVPQWSAAINPFISPGHNTLPTLPVLAQLAQQLATQSALTHQVAQQISVAVQHLAHQLAPQGLQGQYYGQNPFAGSMPGGYPGANPYAQAWGANRPPSIQ
jgi:hypothetical protein